MPMKGVKHSYLLFKINIQCVNCDLCLFLCVLEYGLLPLCCERHVLLTIFHSNIYENIIMKKIDTCKLPILADFFMVILH